jgi:hypothetical protein
VKKRYKLPKGFSLVEADPDIYKKYKQDSAWYTNGYGTTLVAKVQYKKYSYDVLCCGDMRVHYNGNIIRYVENLYENGIKNDKDLTKLEDHNNPNVEWINNSWFEVYAEDQDWDWSEPCHSVEQAINYAIELILAEEKENY